MQFRQAFEGRVRFPPEWRDTHHSPEFELTGIGDGVGKLPAAGMPWFMTVFGRDTLITCLQTLLFGPELAHNALHALAELQAREDDPEIDAEPGKIVHEVRHGKGADAWFPRYYGTVDATPLFLCLLSEHADWTGDLGLFRELRGVAARHDRSRLRRPTAA